MRSNCVVFTKPVPTTPLQLPVQPIHKPVYIQLDLVLGPRRQVFREREHYLDLLTYLQKVSDCQSYQAVTEGHLVRGNADANDFPTRMHDGGGVQELGFELFLK